MSEGPDLTALLRVLDEHGHVRRLRMEAAGLEMLAPIERTATAAWRHIRAPDGTVLEIIGPA